jgi:DNA-binding CsgD family transcriptional regulator
MRKRTDEKYFLYYLFFLVFISIYGLYGLWAPSFFWYTFPGADDQMTMERINRYLSLLGIPFLVAAWFTLLKFTEEIQSYKINRLLLFILIPVTIAFLFLSGIYSSPLPEGWPLSDTGKLTFAAVNIMYYFVAGITLLFLRQEDTPWKASRPIFWIGFSIILAGVFQTSHYVLIGISPLVDSIGIILYFIGMIIPMIVMVRSPLIRKIDEEGDDSFRSFCKRFEISPREAEVVREICLGKSNKEIADTLFISLQTVKDHTHNIFIKTDVKNRTQLTNLVRETVSGQRPA